ncbi:HAD-IIIC family phosphatase [Streptacidiphilus fuscans]|uniref:HAD-IIIC family phosphatase n=1 Tax=Streptacidiphilus fuscans TaxID=2789292 RepID=A0A931B1B1_9ACTN|nr:HAD-IIIC family phosphatase [Streptacidiphilus fuscans]MBF9068413.1 HAD-IIIC family phosphatase [Streptacidiphilus fuscans]
MSVTTEAGTGQARRSALRELRAMKKAGLGGAGDAVVALLDELEAQGDPLVLESAGALLDAGQRAALHQENRFSDYRIALLGSSTLDSLPHLLTAELVRRRVLPEIRSAGFNQWRLEILSGAPALASLQPQLVALLLDDAAVFESVADPLDLDEVERRCAAFPQELADWAEQCRGTLGGLLVLATVPLTALRSDRLVDYRSKARLAAAWQRMNAEILGLATTSERTVVLAWETLAQHAGGAAGGFAAGDRMRHAAGHAFSPEFLHAYAAELARVVRADQGKARKCLVLDLDHTLWGGVVGDDGVAALRIGGAFPGSAHLELQALAADLKAQGVMLAVCSKNEDAVAREAMATHPEMLLRPDSFVAIAASWDPKPQAVAGLARTLNIGSDAMVFVDDNPVERGLMRELRPEVATVELPGDPARYAATVAARGDFNLLTLTEEDRVRTQLYRAEADRAELQRSTGSLDEYLAGLGSELTVEPMNELSRARIVQLFGKTNQFNLTGRRYADDEVVSRSDAGEAVFLSARLRDRFGDNGLIAALAVGRDAQGVWEVENFVLSCRVFSRYVEQAVVGLVLRAALAAGAPEVRASYARTAKNGAFAEFWTGLGFAVDAAASTPERQVYIRDLRELSDPDALPDLPSSISVVSTKEPLDVF